MAEQERGNLHPPGSKKHSIDDIIDHMTADLQSYDGQYILLGSPPPSNQVWSDYPSQAGQPMTAVRSPVYVQQPYEMPERKMADYPPQHGLYYPNPTRVHDGTGEMIGMVDVGGGNYVNVVFNPNNPNQIHPGYAAPSHQEANMGFVHYQQQQPQPSHVNNQPPARDYGLFNTNESTTKNNHQLIENVVGNWLPNKSGTYSPFGGVTQGPAEAIDDDLRNTRACQPTQVKKPRMVAEVRPMRPSYSDVLAKSVPPLTPPPTSAKPPQISNVTQKGEGRKQGTKGTKGAANSGTPKTVNVAPLKRQQSNGTDEQTKANVRRWISLEDLTPPQSSEENSFLDYEATYLDENVGSGSDNYMPAATGEVKKEKKQKKKCKPTEEKCEALNNHKTSGGSRGGAGGGRRPLQINNNLQEKESSTEKNFTKTPIKNARSPQEETKKVGSSGGAGGKVGGSAEERGPSVSRVSRNAHSKRTHRSTKRRDANSYLSLMWKRWQEVMSHYGLMFLTWFVHLIWDVMAMSARLFIHLCAVSGETGLAWAGWLQGQATGLLGRDWPWWGRKPPPPPRPTDQSTTAQGLANNISLPATGDEAMKRLLACKGKDPYSILGVTNHATDDDIKKYYKRQAVLVHPDKNSQPGAEEAFKILVHAFELIGEPERRSAYDRCVAETHQVEQAWSELSELLSQLHHKMEYAANTIRCTNCGKRHKRVIMQRPCYAARFCAQCKIHHSAREGDIWAESWMLGFLWRYYACMEGAVYDITEWANCQAENLKHLRADSHAVQYRIVLGKQAGQHPRAANAADNYNEPDFEEFLNNLYAQSGGAEGGGGGDGGSRQRRKGKRK